jgi:hypothetical protein
VELSSIEARRMALAAQGFGNGRPTSRPSIAHVRRVASRLGAIQIDSVNVLVRSHYLPAFSRIGSYPVRALDDLAYKRRELFEYWGHQASFMPIEMYPLFRWRMESYLNERQEWYRHGRDPAYFDEVLEQVRERGPLSASDLTDPGRARGPWWGWSDGKAALEWLYGAGRVAVAGRRGFERRYDVTERVIPQEALRRPVPSKQDARKRLLVMAARAFGVATAKDLATFYYVDPWWHRPKDGKKRSRSEVPGLLAELVEAKELIPVRVEGWKQPAYLHPAAKIPRKVEACALVSPFDSLIWERDRTLRLFGFHYRIEIYVPAPKRQFGYYVLPFLLGEDLVARVDLKADRKEGTLRVPGAFREPETDAKLVAGELAAELRRMADWLGLDRIDVGKKGDLAALLARAVKSS